ncbi:4-hydroxythreonine-4-phosphate dehydrogenase PdxA [Peptoniphilus indolicus]|uniref:4-hydroxythreonine-4-phosphate dehydrogenase n=2 Tax=Peptoniphilus indolicus TaxID=33030 RepID=G4D4X4_9FIRM|nr:4-hydroxythreonine-4-phosphate dehydrogenase PdxA [Peptoniphilus indolicus]EGY79422.1 4-hydroxythreonine-4-phosphate dehydrogenase [Peptoniphilus indolicus ATCC 29427]SUB74598.1 4-hydroxythreonine-4-phosphate dehydrogenase 2 [Peptoniphilus indolicus]
MKKPIIAIPLGDPAGIGPEITMHTWASDEVQEISKLILVGDEFVVKKALDVTGLDLKINIIREVSEALFEKGTIDLIDLGIVKEDYEFGKVNALCGEASYQYVKKAGELAMAGEVDAVATTPINKESLRAAKVPYIGHTEMFEDISGVKDPLTMFEVENLRVFFLSRHLSLKDAIDTIKYDRVLDYIKRCTEAMHRLGVKGTMAVAGLNPHSGEHGLFGWEEVNEIEPAVKKAKEEGYDVAGPVPADSVFHQALHGSYAAVLSLYHDQGHVATKTYNFEKTISLTNSMPFLRTSVDHGTAYPIAGTNTASSVSMIEAVKVAAKYANQFKSGGVK